MKQNILQLKIKSLSGLVKFIAILMITAISTVKVAAQSPLCASTSTNFCCEYVSNVTFNGISQNTANTGFSSGPGYQDFTSTPITSFVAGNTYPISVTVKTNSTYQEYVKVWIDFNGNGDLQDAGELVYNNVANFFGTNIYTGNVTIPTNAYNGNVYMRVVMVFANIPNLCGNYTYGNTLDFRATISGGVVPRTLSVARTGPVGFTGNVVSTPAGINTASNINSASFADGSNVTLTETPASGGTFINWTGDASGSSSSVSVLMNSNKNVTANFAAATPSDPTSITPSSSTVCAGGSSQLTANGGQGTVYWYTGSCGGTFVTTGNPITVNPTATTTYYARNFNNGTFSNGCASTTITVNQPITISCPSPNPQISAAANTCAATYSYSVSSGGSPAPSLTYTFTGATTGSGSGTGSGSSFNVGSTSVTIKATNICGNATCNFTITVTDNQKPIIITNGNQSVPAQGTGGANVTVSATATDNCGP